MQEADAIDYIHSFSWEKHVPGLDRMRELLTRLGNPEKNLRFIHVAGTNGKGSTCAMLAAILHASGYHVGLNTSTHLVRFEERIQVDGKMIPGEQLASIVEDIRPVADSMDEHPTEFELITAIAMIWFKMQRCDIVILEAGLGGALDASNVINTPEVAVLTAMGMDHAAILGNSLTQVAEAKAGIIKGGGQVVSFGGSPEADAVFHKICQEKNAELTEVDFKRISHLSVTLEGTQFDCYPYGNLALSLLGSYQVLNALLAVTVSEVLQKRGWKISPKSIREGLISVKWPGRLELLRKENPVILLDGAHNPHGMKSTVKSLKQLLPGKKLVLVMGIMADKDVEAMLKLVVPIAKIVFTVTPDSPRAMKAAELAQYIEKRGVPAKSCSSVLEAVKFAKESAKENGAVCILGSLYLAGEVLAFLN